MQGSGWLAGLIGVLLAASLLVASVQPGSPADSVSLFRDVCLEGKASFAPGSIRKIETKEIPSSARSLLKVIEQANLGRPKGNQFNLSNIPTSSFAISKPEKAFLIVPDPDAKSGSGSLCAVFIPGDHYVKSLRMMSEYKGYGNIGEAEGYGDQLSQTVYAGEYNVTSARGDGWTMISAIRVPAPAEKKKE